MNPQLIQLGSSFYIAAAILGLPAAVFLLLDGLRRLLKRLSPQSESPFPVKNPDAILLMLQGMTKGVTTLSRIMGFFGSILANIAAVVSVGALVLSVILFLTARGLQQGQAWARVAAGVMLACLLVVSLISASSVRHRPKRLLLPLLLIALSGYGLHLVWMG